MYKIDLSNKHKKRFIAYVIENGGNIVFVASDTRKKLVNWLQNSLGVYSFYKCVFVRPDAAYIHARCQLNIVFDQ